MNEIAPHEPQPKTTLTKMPGRSNQHTGSLPISLLFNKPYGTLSSFTDSAKRPTLARYISIPSVYPVGRLDYDSEGLMLLTSDGHLSHLVTDPRYKLWKTYWAQVERIPNAEALKQLRHGMIIQGRQTRPASVTLLSSDPALWPRPVPIRYRKSVPTAWLIIKIREGMNRQIRRMTAAVGHPTLRLVRVSIGPLSLGPLQPGHWRLLHKSEMDSLM